MIFRKNFKKIVYGFIEVDSLDEAEAEQNFDLEEYDEFDNKSEYEFEEWVKAE